MSAPRIAYEMLRPTCPTCGQLASQPVFRDADQRKRYFGQLTHEERTRTHVIACEGCTTEYLAQFYQPQHRGEPMLRFDADQMQAFIEHNREIAPHG